MAAKVIALLGLMMVLGTPIGHCQGIGREAVQMLDGIRLEVRKKAEGGPSGTYLVTLNYAPNVIENTPPYRALLLAIDSDGSFKVYRKFLSQGERIWAIDLKPQPDGLYTFALNRPRPPVWVYDLRILDPRDGTEVIEPAGYPIRDPALDGHETVVYHKDRRYFLYYRERDEGGRRYIDMEVSAISAQTGKRVGFWSSKGLFPPEMTGDYLHFNSMFPMSEDRILASSRSQSTLYVINLSTGAIEDKIDSGSWKVLGDPLNGFARQHFAHFLNNGNLLLYDNRDAAESKAHSRAVEYKVDWKERTLQLAWERRAEESMPFRYGWGSASAVGDDEVLVGWGDYPRTKLHCSGRDGSFPVFSHVRRDGDVLFELRAPCGWVTYRVYFVPR